MMNISDILFLFAYNAWANTRVLEAASGLSPAQFIAPAAVSHGSLRGALAHVLAAEVVWRLRCAEGVSPSALPAKSEFPSLEALRERWREEDAALGAYLESLHDSDLGRRVRYTTTRGVPHEDVLWQLLAHLVNHGTQFRAEAAVVLSGYGHSPGDLDLLAFIRVRAEGQ